MASAKNGFLCRAEDQIRLRSAVCVCRRLWEKEGSDLNDAEKVVRGPIDAWTGNRSSIRHCFTPVGLFKKSVCFA